MVWGGSHAERRIPFVGGTQGKRKCFFCRALGEKAKKHSPPVDKCRQFAVKSQGKGVVGTKKGCPSSRSIIKKRPSRRRKVRNKRGSSTPELEKNRRIVGEKRGRKTFDRERRGRKYAPRQSKGNFKLGREQGLTEIARGPKSIRLQAPKGGTSVKAKSNIRRFGFDRNRN